MFNLVKEKTQQIFGKILSLFDRDRFKNSISPGSDWEHILVFVVAMTLVLASISGYLWFSARQKAVNINNVKTAEGTVSKEKIIRALSVINKEEEEFIEKVEEHHKH